MNAATVSVICAAVLTRMEDTVSLESSISYGFYNHSVSSSVGLPEPLSVDIQFRTECSNVSRDLYMVQL